MRMPSAKEADCRLQTAGHAIVIFRAFSRQNRSKYKHLHSRIQSINSIGGRYCLCLSKSMHAMYKTAWSLRTNAMIIHCLLVAFFLY
jgi:hypothetical protein